MQNQLMGFLRGCALLLLLLAGNSARAVYEGPDDPPTRTWTNPVQGACPAAALQPYSSFTSFMNCAQAANGYAPGQLQLSCNTSAGPWFAQTTEPAFSGGCSQIYFRNPTAASSCGGAGVACTLGTSSTAITCPANRSAGIIGGVSRCVSLCYSLKDTETSVFVPIDDPAQNVTEACLFIAGKGQCKIEVGQASNYTYGSQLYRAGTFTFTGGRCDEDPTTPPTIGAVTTSPTGGTGSGSGATVGATSATEDTKGAAAVAAGGGGQTAMETSYVEMTSAVTYDNLPRAGWNERWAFDIGAFLGVTVADCAALPAITFGARTYTYDFCAWLPYWNDLGNYALMLWTAYAIWGALYAPRSGTAPT